jgi:hypothetical protein
VDGIDPHTGKKRTIQLSYDKLKSLPRLGKGRVLEAAQIVLPTLLHPTAIYEGLTQNRDHDPRGVGWLCYAAIPDRCFEDDGKQFPTPSGEVFVVFVNDEWVAYNWYWVKADVSDPNQPDGYEKRFNKRLL